MPAVYTPVRRTYSLRQVSAETHRHITDRYLTHRLVPHLVAAHRLCHTRRAIIRPLVMALALAPDHRVSVRDPHARHVGIRRPHRGHRDLLGGQPPLLSHFDNKEAFQRLSVLRALFTPPLQLRMCGRHRCHINHRALPGDIVPPPNLENGDSQSWTTACQRHLDMCTATGTAVSTMTSTVKSSWALTWIRTAGWVARTTL